MDRHSQPGLSEGQGLHMEVSGSGLGVSTKIQHYIVISVTHVLPPVCQWSSSLHLPSRGTSGPASFRGLLASER